MIHWNLSSGILLENFPEILPETLLGISLEIISVYISCRFWRSILRSSSWNCCRAFSSFTGKALLQRILKKNQFFWWFLQNIFQIDFKFLLDFLQKFLCALPQELLQRFLFTNTFRHFFQTLFKQFHKKYLQDLFQGLLQIILQEFLQKFVKRFIPEFFQCHRQHFLHGLL